MMCHDPASSFNASCPADFMAVESLCQRFRTFLQALDDQGLAFAAELAVREALTNAAQHGCAMNPERTLSMAAQIHDCQLALTISHDGHGFDQNLAIQVSKPELGESGRGLAIMTALSTRCVWEDDGRRVHLYIPINVIKEDAMQTTLAVFRPEQDLTAVNAKAYKDELLALVTDSTGPFRIDLSRISMVDSKGIGLIIAAFNSLQANSRPLEVTGASSEIKSLFKLMRLDRHFSIT
jgi:anti-sigma B factor antagonist